MAAYKLYTYIYYHNCYVLVLPKEKDSSREYYNAAVSCYDAAALSVAAKFTALETLSFSNIQVPQKMQSEKENKAENRRLACLHKHTHKVSYSLQHPVPPQCSHVTELNVRYFRQRSKYVDPM